MTEPLTAAEIDLIEQLCDECESKLRDGKEVDVLATARRCESRLWDRLVPELLMLDISHALSTGRNPTREGYRDRYPELLHHIEKVVVSLSLVGGPTDKRPRSELAAGSVLGSYELIESLGSGASGVVWEARELATLRHVALKVPRWEGLPTVDRLRFFQEGRTASRLNHDNIAKLYEVGTTADVPFLACELVCGETLQMRLQSEPLEPRAVAGLCLSLANALHHAHQRGVIHRDVKPANILIDRSGKPLLTDFGLAKCLSDSSGLTEHGDILGTPAYMSPEQALGRNDRIGHAADIYSLGAVLFEMLTGRTPFVGDRASLFRQIACMELEAPSPKQFASDTPKDLAAICQVALQKRPEDRYDDARVFASDLERYLRNEPVVARPPSTWQQLSRWGMRRRRVLAAFLCVAAASSALAYSFSKPLADDRLRPVCIETEPADARVAFVPLTDGEQPSVSRAVFGTGAGTVRARLAPGDYLVVAATQDGRFHEVYRRVPEVNELSFADWRYQRVHELPDGRLALSKITIPKAGVTQSMVLILGAKQYTPGWSTPAGVPAKSYELADYYLDPVEFRLRDYQRISEVRAEEHARFSTAAKSPGWAWVCSYGDAVDAAEEVGKRLPTELEYEFAATNRGVSKYPWGDSFTGSISPDSFSIVASVPFDCYGVKGVIYGLCSNVAEWTTVFGPLDPTCPRTHAIARGGDRETLEGNPRVTPTARDPRHREYAPKEALFPGLGFRCARSARPLIDYDAMCRE